MVLKFKTENKMTNFSTQVYDNLKDIFYINAKPNKSALNISPIVLLENTFSKENVDFFNFLYRNYFINYSENVESELMKIFTLSHKVTPSELRYRYYTVDDNFKTSNRNKYPVLITYLYDLLNDDKKYYFNISNSGIGLTTNFLEKKHIKLILDLIFESTDETIKYRKNTLFLKMMPTLCVSSLNTVFLQNYYDTHFNSLKETVKREFLSNKDFEKIYFYNFLIPELYQIAGFKKSKTNFKSINNAREYGIIFESFKYNNCQLLNLLSWNTIVGKKYECNIFESENTLVGGIIGNRLINLNFFKKLMETISEVLKHQINYISDPVEMCLSVFKKFKDIELNKENSIDTFNQLVCENKIYEYGISI